MTFDDTNWKLRYGSPKADCRLLISLPQGLHRDLMILAKARGTSAAEILRRAATREVAEFLEVRPEVAKSFKGVLPMLDEPEDG